MPTQPKWILKKTVISTHELQIKEHGGLKGIRDELALDRALDRPKNTFSYENPKPKISDLAAEYAFGITSNHPFMDGNKRIALVTAETFLSINNYMSTASEVENFTFYTNLAAGDFDIKESKKWFRKHTKKLA